MFFSFRGTGRNTPDGQVSEASISESGDQYVLQERRKEFDPRFKPFLNPTFGNQMNQNVAFSGTPEIIHNGGTSTEWTGTGPGTWDFSTGAVVTLTSGNNADTATFAEETPTTVAMSGYTALTMAINLTTYTDSNHTLLVAFDLAGVLQGNAVALDNYIDTSLLGTAQNAVIPKADLGLLAQTVDGFTITLVRLGGSKPTMTFDDIQLEQTGSPATFKISASTTTEEYHMHELRIMVADDVLVGAIPWDGFMGLGALANGITFQRTLDGETAFSGSFTNLTELMQAGATIVSTVTDGTDTMLTLAIEFSEPLVITGSATNNFLSFTINDNMSGLLLFTAAGRGAIVTNG